MIDTGCPYTLIDRASARRSGLKVEETTSYISGVSGTSQRFGVSKAATLAMGNCTFTNVPVQVADENDINQISGPHLDGLFGAHEMAKFGVIVDCARQMLYVNPKGASAATAQKLAEFLTARGFARIPMRFNPQHHLEIDAAFNGHPTRLIVDTGAGTTLISSSAASASGTTLAPLTYAASDAANGIMPVKIGRIHQLALGNLIINNAEVTVGNAVKQVGGGLLGEEYLSWNFGIVDLDGMNLYLRPPESSAAKKR